jgi:hypothetical protein
VTSEQEATSRCYSLFYLLGILMSRPAVELYAELYATGSLQGAFSHVYPDMVTGSRSRGWRVLRPPLPWTGSVSSPPRLPAAASAELGCVAPLHRASRSQES